jgi:hypothetical protein
LQITPPVCHGFKNGLQITADTKAQNATAAISANAKQLGYSVDIAPAPTNIDPGLF